VASEISKTQIDRLGDRLRESDITEADLRLLDEYRRSFSEAYEFVVSGIRDELGLEPTGRPAKSTTSISEKLLRESIRLTQMQDIAGCRLVVSEIANQERVVTSLTKLFPQAPVVDRRARPSHGYRAVHVIVILGNKPVEIQVRTALQHVWAELSEKLADVVDPAIKYGGGSEATAKVLLEASTTIAQHETQEIALAKLESQVSAMLLEERLEKEKEEGLISLRLEIKATQESQISIRENTVMSLRRIIEQIPLIGGEQ